MNYPRQKKYRYPPLSMTRTRIEDGKVIRPGCVVEIKSEEEWEKFNTPHTHVFDSDNGVVRIGFIQSPRIYGLRCTCGEIRIL